MRMKFSYGENKENPNIISCKMNEILEEHVDAETQWQEAVDIFNNGGDMALAYRIFTDFAKVGIPAAYYNLGAIHMWGKMGTVDEAEGFKCFLKGAQGTEKWEGDSDCQVQVYVCYHEGNGVEKDLEKAAYWLQKAVDQDNATALSFMANELLFFGGKEDRNRAFPFAKRAVEKGWSNAKALLAYCYMTAAGTSLNLKEADRLLTEAEHENVESAKTFRKIYHEIVNRLPNSGSSGSSSPSSPASGSSTGSKSKKGGSRWGYGIAALIIGALLYFGWDWVTGLFGGGEPMYVVTETLNVREEATDRSDIVTKVSYGTEVRVCDEPSSWVKVKVNGKKGYMSAAGLATPSEMQHLNSIWGDQEAQEGVRELRCRRALIHFRQQVAGDVNYKLYGSDYQGKNICKADAVKSEDNGAFAFIVDNKESGGRFAVIYVFDSKGNPQLETTDDAVRPGQWIKTIKCNSKGAYYLQYGGKPQRQSKNNDRSQATARESTSDSPTTPAETKPVEPEKKKEEVDNEEPKPSGNGHGFKLERVDHIPNQ